METQEDTDEVNEETGSNFVNFKTCFWLAVDSNIQLQDFKTHVFRNQMWSELTHLVI